MAASDNRSFKNFEFGGKRHVVYVEFDPPSSALFSPMSSGSTSSASSSAGGSASSSAASSSSPVILLILLSAKGAWSYHGKTKSVRPKAIQMNAQQYEDDLRSALTRYVLFLNLASWFPVPFFMRCIVCRLLPLARDRLAGCRFDRHGERFSYALRPANASTSASTSAGTATMELAVHKVVVKGL